MIDDILEAMPVVAILRGIRPEEVVAIGQVIYEQGIRCIEVPLNSPSPLDSIGALSASMPDDCLIGAGTVLSAKDVIDVKAAGGKLIVTPNTVDAVIRTAVGEGMVIMPGVATPTEAFRAVDLGASLLKLFPASTFGPTHLRALKSVLPGQIRMLAVGGVGPADFAEWVNAGAVGFGIGSELYKAGDSAEVVKENARAVVTAVARCQARK